MNDHEQNDKDDAIRTPKTILEEIPYEEFRRLLRKTIEEDKELYDMLANA
jgi:hypothetical protein